MFNQSMYPEVKILTVAESLLDRVKCVADQEKMQLTVADIDLCLMPEVKSRLCDQDLRLCDDEAVLMYALFGTGVTYHMLCKDARSELIKYRH